MDLRKTLRAIRRHYPLTLAGSLLVAGSLYLIGRSFASGSAYAFALSLVALLLLFLMVATGLLQARKAREARFEWNTSGPVYAQLPGQSYRLGIRGLQLIPFYRLHALLRGPIHVGRGATIYVRREVSAFGESELEIPQDYPLSGVFHSTLSLKIRDMFGLTSSQVDFDEERLITIRPALLPDRENPRFIAQNGQENQSRMKSADVERYFMREYIPGDRHRDINWKASSRFKELFTRISPVTQEKTQIITVHFRPFSPHKVDSLRAIAFVDRCKSLMLFFLRSVRAEHPEYEFRIVVGADVVDVKDDADIEQFSAEVSGMFLRNDTGGMPRDTGDSPGGAAFVFTTAYDHALGEVLSAFPGETVHIFRVSIPEDDDDRAAQDPTHFRLFGGGRSQILAGAWLARRDGAIRNVALHGGNDIKVEDEAMEVHIV